MRNSLVCFGCEICLAGGYDFLEGKWGELLITEDAFVGTRVKEFAVKHDFDPELGQELFFKYDIDLTSDSVRVYIRP